MKMKTAISAVLAISFGFFSAYALALNEKGEGSTSSSAMSNNSVNAVKIYENTTAGKKQAEWAKGRVIKPCDSIQAKHPAFARGTTPPKCDK